MPVLQARPSLGLYRDTLEEARGGQCSDNSVFFRHCPSYRDVEGGPLQARAGTTRSHIASRMSVEPVQALPKQPAPGFGLSTLANPKSPQGGSRTFDRLLLCTNDCVANRGNINSHCLSQQGSTSGLAQSLRKLLAMQTRILNSECLPCGNLLCRGGCCGVVETRYRCPPTALH